MVQLVPEGGNTRLPLESAPMTSKRISPSKSWCFTLNNYLDHQRGSLAEIFENFDMQYIMGYEIGDSGTPHIQGYVHHETLKFRPIEKINVLEDFHPHWEKCKGDMKSNYLYCSKGGDFITNIDPETIGIEEELEYNEPYGWQLDALNDIEGKPDKRTIHWYYGPPGIGKTDFVRYLCIKKNALLTGGKATDMKYMMANSKVKPKLIVMDVAMSEMKDIDYTGIEQCKNGLFASPKYESCMYMQNPPHMMVFANYPPTTNSNIIDLNRFHTVELLPVAPLPEQVQI